MIATFISCLAAYGLSNSKFKSKSLIVRLIYSFMWIPPVIVVIPLFEFYARISLINTLPGVVIIYLGFIIPFSVFLIYSFFVTIPSEIVEAARIDGCSILGIFFKIYIPLSIPPIITSIVVSAFWVWNELLIALVFLQSGENKTLMAGLISYKARSHRDLPFTNSGLFIATIPIIILFLFSQKFFTRGLLSGIEK